MTAEKKIREVMRWTGMTQKELAERSGIAYSTLNNYLCGRNQLPIASVHTIAQALGVSWVTLLNGEPLPAGGLELTEDERRLVFLSRQINAGQLEIVVQSMELFIRQNREKGH